MSIDQEKVIDIVGIDEKTDKVTLVITDHLPWEESIEEHIYQLQEKINPYLSAVESGELLEKYPQSKDKKVVVKVVGKYPLPDNDLVKRFYEKAVSTVQWAGFDLQFEKKE